MTATIELEGTLETDDGVDIVLGHGLRQLLLGHVEVVDVGLVMLAVVELHDLGADDGLQGIVIVGKVGQAVLATHTEIMSSIICSGNIWCDLTWQC